VYEPDLVGGRERGGDLRADLERERPRQRPGGQPLGKAAALDQFHHQVRHGRPVRLGRLPVVVHDHDVGMGKLAAGGRLVPDPVPEELIVGEIGGEDLDRDRAAEQLVVATPHDGHTATAEALREAVSRTQDLHCLHDAKNSAGLLPSGPDTCIEDNQLLRRR
jgi:hypothetical protein